MSTLTTRARDNSPPLPGHPGKRSLIWHPSVKGRTMSGNGGNGNAIDGPAKPESSTPANPTMSDRAAVISAWMSGVTALAVIVGFAVSHMDMGSVTAQLRTINSQLAENLTPMSRDYLIDRELARNPNGLGLVERGWIELAGYEYVTTSVGDSVLGPILASQSREARARNLDATPMDLANIVVEGIGVGRFHNEALVRDVSAEQLRALLVSYIRKQPLPP